MLTIAPQIRNGVVAIALNISIAKAQWCGVPATSWFPFGPQATIISWCGSPATVEGLGRSDTCSMALRRGHRGDQAWLQTPDLDAPGCNCALAEISAAATHFVPPPSGANSVACARRFFIAAKVSGSRP